MLKDGILIETKCLLFRLWADFFVDNPASGRVMEKCGFRDTGEVNWLSQLYRGDERPVNVMRLDYAL